jgi:hypothetical protein
MEIIKFGFGDLTKQNYKEKADQLAEIISDNSVDILETSAKLKVIELMVADLRKKIDVDVKTAKQKFDKNEKIVRCGFDISERETGIRYKFDQCGDPCWNDFNNVMEELKEAMKNRESFLKTIKGSINIITDDGEAVTIFEPIKQSTTSIIYG